MLHIVNKSPGVDRSLESCLAVLGRGVLLLIEDGVYAVTVGNPASPAILSTLAQGRVCALRPDLEARGLVGRVLEGVELLGYDDFVALVVSEPNNYSW